MENVFGQWWNFVLETVKMETTGTLIHPYLLVAVASII